MAAMMTPAIYQCLKCRQDYEVLEFSKGDIANLDCTPSMCRECCKPYLKRSDGGGDPHE